MSVYPVSGVKGDPSEGRVQVSALHRESTDLVMNWLLVKRVLVGIFRIWGIFPFSSSGHLYSSMPFLLSIVCKVSWASFRKLKQCSTHALADGSMGVLMENSFRGEKE